MEACGRVMAGGRRTNPAFFGYVQSPPTPIGVAGDLLASAADQNVTSWRSAPSATEVEHVTLSWLGQLAGFAPDASGVFVGGGSASNLTALLVALQERTADGADRRGLTVYTSEETHFSISKAASIIGVSVTTVPTDEKRRMSPSMLRERIVADRGEGMQPFCVVATAGSTAIGAVDPLAAIAAIAAEEQIWLHVDGAYGAVAYADPHSRHLFEGIERADSLALDAHKWLYAPVDCSALLVRDSAATLRAFGSHGSDYVRVLTDQSTEAFAFWDHGIELSRRSRALKLWMTIRYYGASRIAASIAQDIALAAYVAQLVSETNDLELLAGPHLSICCFRHAPDGVPTADLDDHNEKLLRALQRDGRAYLSNATVDGRLALRACITNFRTTRGDIARTLGIVRELGNRIQPDGAAPDAPRSS